MYIVFLIIDDLENVEKTNMFVSIGKSLFYKLDFLQELLVWTFWNWTFCNWTFGNQGVW